MKFAPALLVVGTVAALGLALPEPVRIPDPEFAGLGARAASQPIGILPPVNIPNPLSLLTLFGTCITTCIEASIVKYTDCDGTPTSQCVCPHIKSVLIQASPCLKTCIPSNQLCRLSANLKQSARGIILILINTF